MKKKTFFVKRYADAHAHVAGDLEVGQKDRNEQPQILGSEGQLIAVCAHECLGTREAEAQANAAEIVRRWNAYEDLLAACEQALRHHQGGHSEIGSVLRAAIARARGGK